jgi:transcriptional regulator with XRE-family HTH domain
LTRWRKLVQDGAVELAAVLGRGIKAQRQALGMTQKALAEACFVSPVTAWRWESGRQMPSPKHLGALGSALNTDPVDFLKEPK